MVISSGSMREERTWALHLSSSRRGDQLPKVTSCVLQLDQGYVVVSENGEKIVSKLRPILAPHAYTYISQVAHRTMLPLDCQARRGPA